MVTLTVSQVANELGESVHVVRHWLRAFEPFIPLNKSQAGYRHFKPEALDRLRYIQSLSRQKGLTVKQIEKILSESQFDIASDADSSEGDCEVDIFSRIEVLEEQVRLLQMQIEKRQNATWIDFIKEKWHKTMQKRKQKQRHKKFKNSLYL